MLARGIQGRPERGKFALLQQPSVAGERIATFDTWNDQFVGIGLTAKEPFAKLLPHARIRPEPGKAIVFNENAIELRVAGAVEMQLPHRQQPMPPDLARDEQSKPA